MYKKTIITTILAALIVAIAFAGVNAVSAVSPGNYTLTVSDASNAVLIPDNTSFGTLLAGTGVAIEPTFHIANNGSAVASISTNFTTAGNAGNGLWNGAATIPATSFNMREHGATYAAMAQNTPLGLTAARINDNTFYDINVAVPSGQAFGTYYGTIEVTIG